MPYFLKYEQMKDIKLTHRILHPPLLDARNVQKVFNDVHKRIRRLKHPREGLYPSGRDLPRMDLPIGRGVLEEHGDVPLDGAVKGERS